MTTVTSAQGLSIPRNTQTGGGGAVGASNLQIGTGSTTSLQGVSLATTQNEVESTSPNPALWMQNWEAKKWSDVDGNGVSGGTFIYDPVIISLPNGKVHAFAVGADLYLNHKWYSQSTGWSSWVPTSKKAASSPVVTHYGLATSSTFAVFFVSWDSIPWGGINTSDTDFTWKAIGDGVKKVKVDTLAVLDRTYDQSMSIVGVELTTGELLHTWSTGGTLATSWETKTGSGYCVSRPTIVSCKNWCIDIFVFAADQTLRQLTYRSSNGWGAWQNLSGSFVYDPASISPSSGRIDVFGIGLDGYIYQHTATLTGYEVGSFTRTSIGAPSISSPRVQVTSPGVFSVTTRKSKGVYQQVFYESATGVWTPQGGMTEIVPSA